MLPLTALEEDPSLLLPSLWCSPAILGVPGLEMRHFSHMAIFSCVSSHHLPSVPVCLSLNLCPNFRLFLFLLFFVGWLVLAMPHSMRDLSSPYQGLNPCPLQRKLRVLITGLPGNSPNFPFFFF